VSITICIAYPVSRPATNILLEITAAGSWNWNVRLHSKYEKLWHGSNRTLRCFATSSSVFATYLFGHLAILSTRILVVIITWLPMLTTSVFGWLKCSGGLEGNRTVSRMRRKANFTPPCMGLTSVSSVYREILWSRWLPRPAEEQANSWKPQAPTSRPLVGLTSVASVYYRDP
jgi:hypothetical protein